MSPFDESHVESAVRGTATERGVKAGVLIHAVRVALTGRTASPGLFEMMALLGREETIARLHALITFLGARK
jgi:glutamyl-tRNA synthetase